jgi:hypothetical protein
VLVILPSIISELQHAPPTPKMLRARERAITLDSSVVFFHLRFIFESIQELGSASFVTKISLIALDKSHETFIANDKVYWMKEKINK